MKKRTIMAACLSLLAAGFAAAALAGCGNYKFEEYSYNYGWDSEENWRALEYPDKSISMDGIVDTSEYGEKCLSFSDVNGINMKVYAHMGVEGVFFGFVSNDRYVNYNTSNAVYNNTSVEIQVAPKGTEMLNCNVVQLRLGANGTPDQWVGFPSEDGYSYSNKYIPSMGVVHINGTLNESASGYSVELYLPYASIGLSEKPESVVCAPSFNTMPDPMSSQRATWTMMLGCDLSQPATWYVVDETGMTAHTAGFTEKNAGILQEKGYNEFYYFDTNPSASYYLKTTLTVQTTTNPFLNDDKYPKFGLVNKSENALEAFYIDAAERTGTNFGTVRAIPSTASGTSWQWENNASSSITGHWGNSYIAGKSSSYTYRNMSLETIYYEGDLYYILDGVLVKTVKDFASASVGAIPGFMCFNTKATFANNEFENDPSKVQTEVEKYLAKDAKIDGNLSDWTNEDVNRHVKTATDSTNGNSMAVRAFRGTDGLYVAYEVAHKVSLTPSKWDEGWWKNTNVELYVNGTSEENHYALTTFGNGGYMDGVMVTTRNADRTYSTVAEIFIPFASLEKDGFNKNDTLKVGFAFKSTDGTANSNLNGTDWWALEGTPISDQLTVLTRGIGEEYKLTYTGGSSDVIGTAPSETAVFAGDSVVLAENTFTRSGYTFVGWSDGTNAYAAGEEFLMPAHDATFTARWIAEGSAGGTYGVAYAYGAVDVKGDLPVDANTYATGEHVTLAEVTLTREGYRFAGWSDGENTYAAGSSIFMGSEDITFTAVWEKIYKVTYRDGGEGDVAGTLPDGENYVAGDCVQISNVLLERLGYDFFSWRSSFNDKIYSAGETFTMPDEDVTLTAVWKTKLAVDGSLSDWNSINSKTIGAHALNAGDNRNATWYGVLRDDGLYLAVNICHDHLKYGDPTWYLNTNFEIHLGSQNAQHYVYLTGKNGETYNVGKSVGDMIAAFKSETGDGTQYHSVFEVFFPNSMLSGWKETDGSIRIGVAIKTDGDNEAITGGSFNYASGDPWYMPYGVVANEYEHFSYVTKDGMYLKNEYLHSDWKFGTESAVADDKSITLDGNISDWSDKAVISITGSEQYNGKGATFYGKMTQNGLYLAVDAYHAIYAYGQKNWWDNTNFELRIGEVFGEGEHQRSKQYWVYATGETAFAASESYMQLGYKTERLSNGTYHTVIEVFIPSENLVQYDYMVQNGMIHVGVAWKTNNDVCNDLGVDNGVGSWWVPKNTHINTTPACVTGSGIYTAKNYETLNH